MCRYNGGTRKAGESWSKKLSDKSSLADIKKQGDLTVSKCHGDKIVESSKVLLQRRDALVEHLGYCGYMQPQKEAGFEIINASEESWLRGLATEFESRVIGAWDSTGASRIKTFDKIINKLQTDASIHLRKAKGFILPQIVTLAYDAAERDAVGLKVRKKAPGASLTAAPTTPSMPPGAVVPASVTKDKDKKDTKEKKKGVKKDKEDKKDKKEKDKKKKGKKKEKGKSSSSDSSSD